MAGVQLIETWLDGRRPLLRADLEPTPGAPELTGRRVLAFAGIGRPEKFFTTLEAAGAELVERRAFPDHHPFTRPELDALIARAAALDARLVTTEKDAVRLPANLPANLRGEIAVLPVVLRWRDPAVTAKLLDGLSDHGER